MLLINFAKEKSLRKDIERIIKTVENDKEYYVKKAVEEIKRRLKLRDSQPMKEIFLVSKEITPDRKSLQTFNIILPNLIHKSKAISLKR